MRYCAANSEEMTLSWSPLCELPGQMSMAKQERRHGTFVKPVVVMADIEKKQLDAVVKRSLNGLTLDVFTRQGLAHSPADLRRVAADQADTIVLLQPEDEDSVSMTSVCYCICNSNCAFCFETLRWFGVGEGHKFCVDFLGYFRNAVGMHLL